VITQKTTGAIPVVAGNAAAGIYVDTNDHGLFKKQLHCYRRHSNCNRHKPAIAGTIAFFWSNIILIGSMDNSSLIKKLIRR